MKDYILIYSYDKNLNDEAEYNHIKKYAEKHRKQENAQLQERNVKNQE